MSSSSQSAAQSGRSGRSARDARRRKRKERSARSAAPEPKNIVSGAGQPLDLSVRRELEEQLGHDFSRVRLHTDRDSGQLAELMGADAFAVGQDIFFREGTYRPGTADGQRLLAHELLHTVQNPHGLGALRAGRDLGTVSLPQETVEREAESAAQESLRSAMLGATRGDDTTTEVAPGRSTPGWLRYATVDADRHRLELVDPATLVDRLANGVLRSLRGDPEDRSGRVRVQLARMAPELQDSVLERLEVRLLSSEHDRLLDLVEEVERGPLPFMTSTVPEPVTDEAAALEQERTQDAAAARDRGRQEEKAGDDRGKRAQHRKDADPAGDGGPERGPSTAGGSAHASESDAGTGQAAVRSAAADDKAAAGARRTEQEQARQDDKQATEHAAEQDRANPGRGPEEQAADGPAEQTAGQQTSVAGGEHPTGPGGEQVTAPEAPDNSAAEPGEKDPRGRDQDESSTRTAGDPENEQDADDEPLGLEDEAADTDADAPEADAQDDRGDGESGEAEADDAGTGDAGDSPEADQSDADLTGPGDAAARGTGQREPTDRTRGDAPGVISSPATEDQSAGGSSETRDEAEATDDGASSPEEEQESDDRLSEDLQADKSTEQEVGPDPDEKAEDDVGEDPDPQDGDPGDPDDAELEREQAAERAEDTEAERRDDAARTATDGTGGTDVPGGGTAQPEKLSKADEDARKQATATSSSGSATASASGGGSGGEGSTGARAQPSGTADGVTGGPAPASGSGSPPPSAAQDGTRPDRSTNDAAGKPAERSPGDTTSPEAAGSGDGSTGMGVAQTESATQGMDVTAGRGPATTPDPSPDSGQAAAAGPAAAPKPSPTAGAGGGGGALPPQAQGGAVAEPSAKPARGTSPAVRSGATPRQRQVSRQAAKNVRRGGGGGGGARTASTPARGGRSGGGGGSAAPAKAKKDAAPPDVSQGTPEAGLATVAKLKPYQMLETFKGVNSAVGNSVGKERTTLRNAPPRMERPVGSPRTVPGGPKPAAPGTYSNEKVARTDAAKGRTDEITGEQRPDGKAPGSDVPEPSWWDILLTIGGALLKRIFPFDDLIDSIMGLPTTDDGLKGARVGNAPGLPLRDDSDPQRTDEQSQKLDERKGELHQSGREDAARPMGEDQIYPDAPRETLTGKVPGGAKQTGQKGGAPATAAGGVPVESASAVAEHDRGPQIQAGFSQGMQRMGKERRAKDDKAKADKEKHDRDLKREVDTSTKKQAGEREKGQQDIADARDKWRKEQDDKVAEIDDKKGKKFEKVRKDVDDKQEQTDKDVDKRTEDDNQKIDDEHTNAENDAQQEQDDKKKEAEKGDGGFLDQLKQWWQDLKDKIKQFFERARKAVTDLIDKFKREVFKLIDEARNWVVQQINDFADALIAFGDEMLADYPAMRDKWRNTINAGRNYAVKKVNEAADTLKDVAGSLLDGLGGALLAGLDVMEDGLLKAVDVAENVTVSAVEFGQQAIAALGEWAAIFSDIVSDPGDWISKAGTAAETGAKEHLFDEIKSAVKEWFNQKVQEITGLSPQEFQELLDGNVSVQEMGQMAWDAAVPQLPVIIGTLVIEKVVAKLIPGVGWVMGIIDALKTAWGTLSRILAAFGLVMDFLKAVKSGNGAVPFAKAVAAGVVALLELVYQALIDGISRFMGGVTKKLGGILKNLRTKRRPGGHGEPGAPGAPGGANRPGRPGHEPGAEPHTAPTGRTTDPHHTEKPGEPGPATDKPGQRPAPRKPSPDKTSHPEPAPHPTKRPSPEKKPHPKDQPEPKSKKKPDAHERRENGREVNDARRRLRNAKNKEHNENASPSGPKRRGPARDTLRPKGRPGTRTDKHHPQGEHPAKRRPGTKRRPSEDPLKKHRPTTKHPKAKDRKGPHKPTPKRRPSPARRALRRARHTVKSALARARRAARRLFGKARHLGHRLQHHAHRLRNRWRHHRDRLRNKHHRRQNGKRDPKHDKNHSKEINLPEVRFRDVDDHEVHILMFHGRGPRAPMYIHSTPEEVPPFLADWRRDLRRPEAKADEAQQQEHLLVAERAYAAAKSTQKGIPTRTQAKENEEKKAKRTELLAKLRGEMRQIADAASQRKYYDIPTPPAYQDFRDIGPGRGSEEHVSRYLGSTAKTVFGGGGEDASRAKDGQPPGWDYVKSKKLSQGAAWVRMHLLPERLGGKAKGNNLVPARGPATNIDFLNNIEDIAYRAIPGQYKIIWYKTKVEFDHPGFPDFPSYISAEYGGYDHTSGTGRNRNDWTARKAEKKHSQSPQPPAKGEEGKLLINHAGWTNLSDMLGVNRSIAEYLIDVREALEEKGKKFNSYSQVEILMRNLKKTKQKNAMPQLELMLGNLRKLIKEEKVDWS
ncbi:DUF4157 domain-containing protein [Streptomyces noursei]|uniref:eCIS core domain-containing protein n=1 Tax=Streptomyces noursei TaxID=1971 RepID=UPI00167B6AAF|nr:DUF4157 domain-containing protein [Streptomyces noursei]MCZ1017580.1 DUF4157 domain-containing protein [Streptomyces noursei]GGX15365.1 hypothetical protein GCM10010341_41070 [Streptomyces noursei]